MDGLFGDGDTRGSVSVQSGCCRRRLRAAEVLTHIRRPVPCDPDIDRGWSGSKERWCGIDKGWGRVSLRVKESEPCLSTESLSSGWSFQWRGNYGRTVSRSVKNHLRKYNTIHCVSQY